MLDAAGLGQSPIKAFEHLEGQLAMLPTSGVQLAELELIVLKSSMVMANKSTIIAGRLVGLQHMLASGPTTAPEAVPNWHQGDDSHPGTGCTLPRPNLADILLLSSSIANSSSSASITGYVEPFLLAAVRHAMWLSSPHCQLRFHLGSASSTFWNGGQGTTGPWVQIHRCLGPCALRKHGVIGYGVRPIA